MKPRPLNVLFLFLLSCLSLGAFSQTFEMPDISVLGGREEFDEPGSVQVIRSERLQQKQVTDPHEALGEVSGLYVREEDGFGLRPNIGLRGAHSDRSSKITLLEDGVMISPAPYSAPAAYYFPLMQKVDSVEVFKGPSTLKYGPNSIGGALNFITRPMKDKNGGSLNIQGGSFNSAQINVHQHLSWKRFQVLIEGHRWQSDGFKTLDDGSSTGFFRDDVLIKTRYDIFGDQTHLLDLKVNWSDEASNETYLGTTFDDFDRAPFERYAASSNDRFETEFWSKEIRLFSQWSERVSTQLTAYRHDFTRAWGKFERFDDSANIDTQNVLLNPSGANEDLYRVLTGDKDSDSTELLRYGINDRDYYSQGVQFETDIDLGAEEGRWTLETGFLLHQDEINRNHRARNFNMVGGAPVFSTDEFIDDDTNQEVDRSDVFRGFALMQNEFGPWTFRYGSRYESVASRRNEKLSSERKLRQQDVWIPGGAVSYKISDDQVAFLGIHKGITLPGPGEDASTLPEEAINYEFGYRMQKPVFAEVVGFYSDYKNLLGTCTFSGGCDTDAVDVQYNSGRVEIYGVEFQTGAEWRAQGGYQFPVQLTTTYTEAKFSEGITSENKIWGEGEIDAGDPLPYVPRWKSSLSAGVQTEKWSVFSFLNYQSLMFDQAVSDNRQEVPAYWTLNLTGEYKFNAQLKANLKLQNVTNEQYIVSIRPLGVRPGAPFMAFTGLTYSY